MNKHITLRRMKNAIKYFVDQSPNFVYEEEYCNYVKDGKPSCLIGKALHKLGVPIKLLIELDHATSNGYSCCIGGYDFLATIQKQPDGWIFDQNALDFASTVQDRQDARYAWKQCYEETRNNKETK